jgi:hypothetical protein
VSGEGNNRPVNQCGGEALFAQVPSGSVQQLLEDFSMKKLLVMLLASAFTVTAFAQAPKSDPAPKTEKKAEKKAKAKGEKKAKAEKKTEKKAATK